MKKQFEHAAADNSVLANNVACIVKNIWLSIANSCSSDKPAKNQISIPKHMKTTLKIYLLAASLLSYGCSASKTTNSATDSATGAENTSSVRDGSSEDKAIIVSSVGEEYRYVKQICPECKFVSQSLISGSGKNSKKHYDILHFRKDGAVVDYYFDINKFFGKGF